MTEFAGIVRALAQALDKRGYTELTPVQCAVLDQLDGVDGLVSAQTGSGKTVAFGLALAPTLLGEAERFGRPDAPLALAVAPTRELALQVQRELEWLYEETGASIASCVGGMDMRTERRALERGAHIVVGTPGRLRDHITRGSLDMSQLKAIVLDEADEMLDLGFRDDLEFILGAAPADRRTLMFSATVPPAIAQLAKNYQRNAVRIDASAEQPQHLDIAYRALAVASGDRENAIVNVLRFYEAKNALVFCGTRAAVNHMTARFNNRGFAVVALSGELSQSERTHALLAMRDGRARVCIATDVAARGIDLPNLDLVVHADLPTNPETLLHRSGRTGRAGRKGVSVLIVPRGARKRTERLLQSAGIVATWARPPSSDDVLGRDDERLLADPALSEPLAEHERDVVGALLQRHGPEQVAAAFMRLHRAGRSAPEDLVDEPAETPASRTQSRQGGGPRAESRPRTEFGPSVWFSVSVGRKQNAEPRWLLPMLCRAGNITKREIGAIKLQAEETFVEIAAPAADNFATAIGPNRQLENNIRVARLDGVPRFERSAGRSSAPRVPDTAPRGDTREASKPYRKRFEAKSSAAKGASGDDGAKSWAGGPRKPKPSDAGGKPAWKKKNRTG